MRRREFVLGAVLSGTAVAGQLPELYHDEQYGDAPYLTESGWRALLNGRDLAGWHASAGRSDWFTTKAVHWKRVFNPTHLVAEPAPGDRIVNGASGKTANLETDESFGSFELYAEFMTAKGSNSGIYLHSLYEVQIFDSYGFAGPLTVGDCGGIYEQEEGTGGSPPLRNASFPPGYWQSVQIWFAAPQFDGSGKKTANARVRRVLLNGVLVQQEFELTGPTRGSAKRAEAARNPLILQGDHSAIAYRNIFIRTLG